ncbi:UbiA family prenyltransferase [Nocardioides litoris]|uniref:UbiA family prenyltransferase n=1 Tax=Nocardioides litoris TaxID=1926648 RepID=UPI00111DB123|nr:UbiA family prenyltransferase [Nocardioides litoris]
MVGIRRPGKRGTPAPEPEHDTVEGRPATAPPATAETSEDTAVEARTAGGTTTATEVAEVAEVVEVGPADPGATAPAARPSRLPRVVRESQTYALLQAAHPRQALAVGVFLGLTALATDRPLREAAVVAATGLVGQAVLGWHNDVVDRDRDRRHRTPRKPVADGRLQPGSTWYAVVLALLLLVPLSISTGVTAGAWFLGSLAAGLVGNVVLRRGTLSFLSWAAQFALWVPYLSHGGWGGAAEGAPPEPVMVVLFALLGVGVHVVRSIWGLVADDADGWTYLPLVLGRRLGASRLLAVAAAYVVVVLAAIVVVGGSTGLRA